MSLTPPQVRRARRAPSRWTDGPLPRAHTSAPVRAQLRGLYSPDVVDLAAWQPSGDDFAVFVQLLVGPADGAGEESFDVLVCSPAHLAAKVSRDGARWLRHVLVVDRWEWGEIRTRLEGRVAAARGRSWQDVAATLGRWALWEFEDYDEDHPSNGEPVPGDDQTIVAALTRSDVALLASALNESLDVVNEWEHSIRLGATRQAARDLQRQLVDALNRKGR